MPKLLRAALDDMRDFWAFWKTLPRKPKTKGWGAIGGLSNEEIDELPDEDIWLAEPEPEQA